MRRRPLVVAALVLAACGGTTEEGAEARPATSVGNGLAASGAGEASPTAGAGLPAIDWQDPEPAQAQALAESVVGAPENRDKTTRLAMRMTTLVDRRTGIEGFATTVAGETRSLEDRLSALDAEVTATRVVIRLPGSVLFDFDSDQVRADAERTLGEVVAVLAAYAGRPVSIEGHTDAIGTDAYNADLSQRRAESVRRWLADHGMQGRATTVGHGEAVPVADNATPAGRQLNRRVEIVIGPAG